ncbi:MAG: hypothetical protein M1819_003000 [Sarea resinae]|nr:MAG: hypothetical protein M1819_003000 [Sarea resinae]
MVLPDSTFAFTVPSLHDGSLLECRIYHPVELEARELESEQIWSKRGALFAHPYAPLGGCYDDPVVDAVAGEILRQGYVVGTFNFRGAGHSEGKTSWTAKAELADYTSVVGFFLHYLHNLDPSLSASITSPSSEPSSPSIRPSSPGLSHIPIPPANGCTVLILGGYSYGSLIASTLPPTEDIVARFAQAAQDGAEADIKARAQKLARYWNRMTQVDVAISRGRTLKSQHVRHHSTVIRGEDGGRRTQMPSRDERRSVESIRRSVDSLLRRSSPRSWLASRGSSGEPEAVRARTDMPIPRTAYLLISPLLPPVSSFITFFSDIGHRAREKLPLLETSDGFVDSIDRKADRCPTLAVYGDKDVFTSQKKLRKWAEHLVVVTEQRFCFREVAGAGHFWHEEGVEEMMRKEVGAWAGGLVQDR